MRFLIADDHAVVRLGLRQILTGAFPKAVFGEAADARQTLALLERQKWDLLLLDISMPGRNGLEVLEDLKKVRSAPPVIVVSVHSEDQYALRAIRAGAAGYLTKSIAPEELVKAAQRVLAGGKYVTASLGEKLAGVLTHGGDRLLHETLSNREFQVLNLLAAGRTAKEVAAELSLSVKTISTYRARTLLKMGMRTNAELMRYAVQHGLVD